ncbi:MAG: hypothetical protein IT285_15185 [Bdellovibrionales bacterium]|nr:hypothetical protein [Bdellovibrionales bacterium]
MTAFIPRSLTWVLVASLLVQAGAPAALAQDPGDYSSGGSYDDLSQICWSDGAPETGTESPSALYTRPVTSLSDLVDHYLRARAAGQDLESILLIGRIKEHLFSEAFTPDYEAGLRYIDSRHWEDPASIHELAKSLQIYWEIRYANGLAQRRNLRVDHGIKGGFIMGVVAVLVLGAAMMRRPGAAPKYFKTLRAVLPLAVPAAGSAIGGGGAYLADRMGLLDGEIPRSPAHVMRLGESGDEIDLGNEELVNTMISAGAGMTAAMITLRVLRAVRLINAAATPLKAHPAVLIGSLVVFLVGLAVEEGVSAWLEHAQWRRMVDPVHAARNRVVRGARAGQDLEVLRGADALVRSAIDLAVYINRPIMTAIEEYEADMGQTMEANPDGGAWVDGVLVARTRALSERIETIMQDAAYPYHGDHEGYLVRGFLRFRDSSAIQDLGAMARRRAQGYLAYFDRWQREEEERLQQSLGSQDRDWYFARFLDAIDHAKDTEIANEFIQSGVRAQANHVLLQAVALLRTTKKAYVVPQADELMAQISRNELLLTTLAGAGVLDGTM